MTRIYDISLPVSSNVPVWPGDPAVRLEQVEAIDQGAAANVTYISASAHTGTHVDAPHHFLNDGRTVEQLPLEVLIGPCYVIQLPDGVEDITARALEGMSLPAGVTRLLFGTRNSRWWARGDMTFHEDFVAITADGAHWLVEHGIRLTGIDYLSIAPYTDATPTHEILLRAGVVILEGLDLSTVPRGFYELYCLPLKILGAEGAPARAILIQR
ncbi:MAG: cyclase family protein [Anaerolineales bacterium]